MSSSSSPHSEIKILTSSRSQDAIGARGWIGWSSLALALVQSVCTLLAAMAGLRLVIGIGSLTLSAEASAVVGRIHASWLRIPMICLALIGTLLNLLAILRLRRLRTRPASQWRQKPIGIDRVRMERLQVVLSLAALALIVLEEYFHLKHLHTL